MKREMVRIDESLCTGCGLCIPNCHEGALKIIDGKAVLVSDLMCDGLGACLGHCPEGAITIEKREAEPYNEISVIREMSGKNKNSIIAHLVHLKEHGEDGYLQEGIDYLRANRDKTAHNVDEIIAKVMEEKHVIQVKGSANVSSVCQGSAPVEFRRADSPDDNSKPDESSALSHWPVQMHLINPAASFFSNSDLLVAADCTAFSLGGFHSRYIKGKTVVIACPKLDHGTDSYLAKLIALIDQAHVNTITVVIMEVPCCSGLLRMVKQAVDTAKRKVPVKLIVASTKGDILKEEWT